MIKAIEHTKFPYVCLIFPTAYTICSLYQTYTHNTSETFITNIYSFELVVKILLTSLHYNF